VISSTRYRASAEIARQSQLAQEIAKLQESISTNKRLAAPSDDPTAANRISEIRQTQASQTVWSTNIKSGQATSDTADSTLGSVQTLLNRAKELMLKARNDSTSDIDRASIAGEIRGLITDLNTYAQTTDQTGRSLFPVGSVLAIPVSDNLNLPTAATRGEVFDQVTTSGGTKTISAILTDAADSLGLTNVTLRNAGVDASLSAIDAAGGHVTQMRADQGVRGQRFDDAATRLQASSDALIAERSGLENTDLTYALSTYQSKQVSLQAAQTVFAQSHKSSLFDLIG
jgi:flagellar hook-associated protein 3 FlgL